MVYDLVSDFLHCCIDSGETPLIQAARQSHTSTAKYLIEHGANPALASELGATALHHVVGTGDIELMEALLSTGVEVDSQSDAGTPLVWASGHGQQDALKLLLKHKADVRLHLWLLLMAGGKVNITAGGATPLHVAADIGNSELITCLLKSGADPNEDWKPVQVATLRGNRGAVEVLFPVSSHVETIPKWSVDGIIQYMQSEGSKNQEVDKNTRKGNLPSDATQRQRRKQERQNQELKSNWAKAWYREGAALRLMQACFVFIITFIIIIIKFEEAANAFYEGVKLDPENKELVHAFREAIDARIAFHGTKNDKEK
ncbi:hypothetical protein LXL04_037202 [Taraxacum kok-saghyz]